MNRFLMYILPLFGAILFSCSQQNETSYVEEVDEIEMAPAEEKSKDVASYYWEVLDEQQNQPIESKIELDVKDQLDDAEVPGGGIEENKESVVSGSEDLSQSTEMASSKEKVLKAFVKTNMEDVLDLLSLYKTASQDEEMAEVAKLSIEEYLVEITFEDVLNSLLADLQETKKLKMTSITLDDDGTYRGSITIKTSIGKVEVIYLILSKQTEFGLSRKFQIVGIN